MTWQDDGERRVKLAIKVARLQQADTYPDESGRIESLETHRSWVFLTERHAYKLKKPVRYPFLDLSSLEARRRNCIEEIRLNRRLAPTVYEGLSSLTLDEGGRFRLDGDGKVIDWLVRMRRLPAGRMLDRRIEQGGVSLFSIRPVAAVLARFYQGAPAIKISGDAYRSRFVERIRQQRRILARPSSGLPRALVERVHDAQQDFLRCDSPLLKRRAAEGRIVEGHGDLRPEHICLEARPAIFDCLEFSRWLRVVDPIDELAFLAMECERIGAPELGPVIFRLYARLTGDTPPQRLIDFYKSYRACLWAKLATRRMVGRDRAHWRMRAEAYLRLAAVYVADAVQE